MCAKQYKISIVNSILDNVHGFIGLTKVENQIERLPIFKRLQNISQLGLSHRVFPCALHNRYIHSLGVMYIVDQMAVKLDLFDDNERQLLRLAGMLHDIGHYPLSHDIETVYKNRNNLGMDNIEESVFSVFCKNAKGAVDRLKTQTKVEDFKLGGHGERNPHHENMGAMVLKNSSEIKNIIKELYVQGNEFYESKFSSHEKAVEKIIEEISAIITGNARYKESLFPDKLSVMIQLMHSEIDADRIDYLLRDATFSGASYGVFDLGMLIQTLTYGEYHGHKIVGVNLKGIGCIEQFLLNRYLAYNQVINHKYTSITGCVLQAVVSWFLKTPDVGYKHADIPRLIKCHEKDSDKKYLYFTDDFLISFINGIDENNQSYPEEIRVLLRCLKSFQSFDMVSEEIVVSNTPEEIATKLKESAIYINMETCGEKDISKIYQYREILITSHHRIEDFKNLLENSNKKTEEEKLPYYIDRLQDGAAVIEEGVEPYLLVDSPRSIMHNLCGTRYSILREYDFSRFKN